MNAVTRTSGLAFMILALGGATALSQEQAYYYYYYKEKQAMTLQPGAVAIQHADKQRKVAILAILLKFSQPSQAGGKSLLLLQSEPTELRRQLYPLVNERTKPSIVLQLSLDH